MLFSVQFSISFSLCVSCSSFVVDLDLLWSLLDFEWCEVEDLPDFLSSVFLSVFSVVVLTTLAQLGLFSINFCVCVID